MITKQDCEIMYYLPPVEYQVVALDLENYPEWLPNVRKEKHLRGLLLTISKEEYLKTLIYLFLEKYPDAQLLRLILLKGNLIPDATAPSCMTYAEVPYRADVSEIVFNFKNEDISDDRFLYDLRVVFNPPALDIITIVLQSIQSKTFQTTILQNTTVVYTIQNSPIARIEISGNIVHFFYDKTYYIDEYRYC